MRIALVGYGRMGHLVHDMAVRQGHEVVAVIDPVAKDSEVTSRTCESDSLKGADVVIEFASAEGILDRFSLYGKLGIPTVVGTTGWQEYLEKVRAMLSTTKCAIIWSGNFALGVHLFLSIVRTAARLANRFTDYDPLVLEYFHKEKSDSPSGTAEMIGKVLLEELERKERLEIDRLDRKRDEQEIHIASARGGYHAGTHMVLFDSPVDTIEITHRAKGREGFAAGALQAATWISDGKCGFFSIDEMLGMTGKEEHDDKTV